MANQFTPLRLSPLDRHVRGIPILQARHPPRHNILILESGSTTVSVSVIIVDREDGRDRLTLFSVTLRRRVQRRVGNNMLFSTQIIIISWLSTGPLWLPRLADIHAEEELDEIRCVPVYLQHLVPVDFRAPPSHHND